MLLPRSEQFNSVNPAFDACLEAIDFQVNSGFPKELDREFQAVIDYVKAYDAEHGAVDSPEKALLKHKHVEKMIKEITGPKLKKIVKKYTNFEVYSVVTELPSTFDAALGFAMSVEGTEETVLQQIDIINIINAASGEDPITEKTTKRTLDAMLDMSKTLHRKKGIVGKNEIIKVKIFLPVGGFVINDLIKTDKYNFTPNEITAIFLHEVGHIMSFVEYTRDLSYYGYYGNNILRKVNEMAEQDPINTAKATLSVVKEKESQVKNKTHKLILKNASMLLEKIISVSTDEISLDEHAAYKNRIVVSMIATIISIIFSTLFLALVFIPYILLGDLFLSIEKSDEINLNSRELRTQKNSTMYERLADEYVSRHQYSKHLNSGLIKFSFIVEKIINYGFNKPMYSNANKLILVTRTILNIFSTIPSFMMYIITLQNHGFSSTYEHDLLRLRRNIQNLHDLLKDPKLSPEIKSSIVADIDEMEATLANVKSKYSLNMFEKLFKFILNIPSSVIMSPKFIFGSGNIEKQYEDLFEYFDIMLSNKSFYYSQKIDSIINKR